MIVGLKVLHIASLAVWCAGLLVLPTLFALRPAGHEGPRLWRLQRFARSVFIRFASPAAFLAIGSGTALVFAREVYDVWFAVKLLAVGLLTILHVRAGFEVVGVFRRGEVYAAWRAAIAQGATAIVIVAILYLVLAKPVVDLGGLPAWMSEPGGLQSFTERFVPIP
jgi:uncharacterized membrane protein